MSLLTFTKAVIRGDGVYVTVAIIQVEIELIWIVSGIYFYPEGLNSRYVGF